MVVLDYHQRKFQQLLLCITYALCCNLLYSETSVEGEAGQIPYYAFNSCTLCKECCNLVMRIHTLMLYFIYF